jgi:hypothetical protein
VEIILPLEECNNIYTSTMQQTRKKTTKEGIQAPAMNLMMRVTTIASRL